MDTLKITFDITDLIYKLISLWGIFNLVYAPYCDAKQYYDYRSEVDNETSILYLGNKVQWLTGAKEKDISSKFSLLLIHLPNVTDLCNFKSWLRSNEDQEFDKSVNFMVTLEQVSTSYYEFQINYAVEALVYIEKLIKGEDSEESEEVIKFPRNLATFIVKLKWGKGTGYTSGWGEIISLKMVKLSKFLRHTNISLGFEVSEKDLRDRDTIIVCVYANCLNLSPTLQILIVEYNIDQLFYTFEDFDLYMENSYRNVETKLSQIFGNFVPKIVIKVRLDLVLLALKHNMISIRSLMSYGQIVAKFLYEWGHRTRRYVVYADLETTESLQENGDMSTLFHWTSYLANEQVKHRKHFEVDWNFFEKKYVNQDPQMLEIVCEEYDRIILRQPKSVLLDLNKFVDVVSRYQNEKCNLTLSIHFNEPNDRMGSINRFTRKFVETNKMYPGVLTGTFWKLENFCRENSNHSARDLDGQSILKFLKPPVNRLRRLANVTFGISECHEGQKAYRDDTNTPKSLIDFADEIMIDEKWEGKDKTALKNVVMDLNKLHSRFQRAYQNTKRIIFGSKWTECGYVRNRNCYEFKTFWEVMLNWAKVHDYEISFKMDDSTHLNTTGYEVFDTDFGVAWYKEIELSNFYEIDAQVKSFMSKFKDTCIILDEGKPRLFEIDKVLSGVTFNLTHEPFQNLAPRHLARLIKLIHYQFHNIELVVGNGDIVSPTLLKDTLFIVENRTDANLYSKYKYYLNIGNSFGLQDKNSYLKKNIIADIGDTVQGVHFELPLSIVKNLSDDNETYIDAPLHSLSLQSEARIEKMLRLKVNELKPVVKEVGIALDFRRKMKPCALIKRLVKTDLDYIILNVKILQAMSFVDLDPYVNPIMMEVKLKNFYLPHSLHSLYKLFNMFRVYRMNIRKLKPGFKVILRLGWPTAPSMSSRGTEDYLKMWKFVSEFSTAFEFPFIVFEAFDGREGKEWSHGWWQWKDYSDVRNLSNVFEKMADYFGNDTPKPGPWLENQEEKFVPLPVIPITIGLLLVGLMVLLIISYLGIRLRKQEKLLSSEEVQDFLEGLKDSQKGDGHIFGLKYDDNYEIGKHEFSPDFSTVIGSGNFGIVYKTKMCRFQGEVAVKTPVTTRDMMYQSVKSILCEIKVMGYIGQHPNILRYLGSHTKGIEKGSVFMVTEYCEQGSLQDYLRSMARENEAVALYELYRYCQEIASGMVHLAEKRVVHGDLSTRNVLMDRNGQCKISDFGLSRKLEQYEKYAKKTEDDDDGLQMMPWRWMALECLERNEFTIKSDIWSVGVTFWEVFSLGAQPYPNLKWNDDFCQKLRSNSLRLPQPENATLEIYQKLKQCWDLEPTSRPDAIELVDFFRLFRGNEYAMA